MKEEVRGGPHPGVATRNRCGNRLWGISGARTCCVQAGLAVGLSESVASILLPENGGKPKPQGFLERWSQATLGPALDENTTSWM